MSAKNRATGDTEDEFQAALVTYTKAGNKTAAMWRLWNTVYEMGKSAGDDAVFEGRAAKDEPVGEKKRKIEEARQTGFEEGRQTGFEEGRQAGERDALSMDVFDVSFGSGKMAGMVMGMELGREAEKQRWKDGGHFEDGTCCTFAGAVIVDLLSPPRSLPLDDAAGTFPVHAELNWANDTESLPIHSLLFTPQPRDFSDLRTGSQNPFDTLQRRHARNHGAQTRQRRARQPRLYSSKPYSDISVSAPPLLPTPSDPLASKSYGLPSFGILAWIWFFLYGPEQGHVHSG
ncbi:hypothetical protein B0H14DRAFT_3539961 [Mycena olivaceomarginata]|nr:hypothetical protein B0H14DRAFT_3539961 [Mycena olivaceomarginata]